MALIINQVFAVTLVDRRTPLEEVHRQFRENALCFEKLDPVFQQFCNTFWRSLGEGIEPTWHRDRLECFLNIFVCHANDTDQPPLSLFKSIGTSHWKLYLPATLDDGVIQPLVDELMKEIVAECQTWLRRNTPVITMDVT